MTIVPDLSIIIVNWHSAAYLRKCLQSVFTATHGLALEILVVDNASYDGCAEMLAREFPAVRFIQSTENLGFARANNLAFEQSTGRNLLFLNPDTEVTGPALPEMSLFLDATPDAGVVGCRLLNSDGSVQTSCIQAFPTISNHVLDSRLLRGMFPKSRLWGMKPLFEDDSGPADVEMVSGACLMTSREAFQSAGCFTEDYFMYGEDLDLCWKLKRAGRRKNYYLGSRCVIHHGGQSSNNKSESEFASIVFRESIVKFLRMRRGAAYAMAYRVATGLNAGMRLGMCGLAFLASAGLYRREGLMRGFKKWRKVLSWALGLEGWAGQLGVNGA